MKILLKITSAFLYFNFATPVLMYYIYDDNPIAGYVSQTSSNGYRISDDKNHKHNNEYVVDSHFKAVKSPRHDNPTLLEDMIKNNVQQIQKNKDQTKRWEQKSVQEENNRVYHDTRRRHVEDVKTPQGFNSPPISVKDKSNSPKFLAKQQVETRTVKPKVEHRVEIGRGLQVMKENLYDNKPSFVEVNVRKTQVSTDPQKVVKINNNRQPTDPSTQGAKANPIAPSIVLDNKQHTSVSYSVRNSQIMSRVLDDLTRKLSERNYKKSEYKKRDISNSQNEHIYEKSERNNISDNMKKYIGKEKSMKKDYRSQFIMEQARSGSMDGRDTPYALFYRMNPETLDQRDGFILKGSMEEDSRNILSNKNKRYPVNYSMENEFQDTKSTISNNGKLHMKVKRFKSMRRY